MPHATTRSRIFFATLTATLMLVSAFSASAREKAGPWSIGKLINKDGAATPPTPVQTDLTPNYWIPGDALINSPINNSDVQVFPSVDPQTESSISVSYTNPLRFLITSNSTPTATGQGYYYSLDGGASWAGSINYPNNNANFGDPVSLHDNLGNTFDVTLRSPSGIGLISSADYGVTWGAYQNIDPLNSNGCDKEMGHVDRKVGSPFENQVYVAWTDFNLTDPHVILTRSGDGYANRTDLSAALGPDLGQGCDVTTGPNGEVYVTWAVYAGGFLPEAGIGFARSLDGGASWTPASQVFPIVGIRSSNGPNVDFNNTRVNGFPSISCDISNGPNSGRIYIVYSDRSTGDSDIYCRHSDDMGATWSAAVRVHPDPVANGKQQWFPWIDCDPINGDVSVAYFSMDAAGSGFQTKTWVSHSTDGGVTWDGFPVQDVYTIPTALGGSFAAGYAGDYLQICAYNGRAWTGWFDNRTGQYNCYWDEIVYADPDDPNAPSSISATSDCTTPTSIQLDWTDPTTRVDGTPLSNFEIQITRVGGPTATVDQGIETYTDGGLIAGTLYTYELRTHDQDNDSLSIVASITKYAGGDPTPSAPTLFSVTAIAGPSFQMDWTNPTTNVDGSQLCDFAGVNVYRNGAYLATVSLAPGDIGLPGTYTDASPIPGLNCYKLTAIDSEIPVKESSFTAEICVEVPLNPPFSDCFDVAGAPDGGKWTTGGVVIDALASNPPTPPNAANLDGTDVLTSRAIDMGAASGLGYVVLYQKEQTGNAESPDPTNDLIVEFYNSNGVWDEVGRHLGVDGDEIAFTTHILNMDSLIPSGGTYFHSQFRFRFRTTGDTGFDNWFVDCTTLDIPSCSATITVAPLSVDDALVAGDPTGDADPVTVSNSCQFNALTWSAAENPDVTWLTLSGAGGTISGLGSQNFVANFNATGMTPGVYNTTIDVISNDAGNPLVTVTATLTVADAPDIAVSPTSITNTLSNADPAAHDAVTIDNVGSGPLEYSIVDAGAAVGPFAASQFVGIKRADGSILPMGAAPAPVASAAKQAWYAAPLGDAGARLGRIDGGLVPTQDPVPVRVRGRDRIKNLGDRGQNIHYPPQPFAQGGPDGAGYRWIDSDEANGPLFNWVDISGIGTDTGLTGDDQNLGPFALGFPFNHYGATFTGINVCSNGFLSFTSTATAFTNSGLPLATAPLNLLAPFWDDLNVSIGGTVYYYADGANDRFIVQWDGVPYYADNASSNTFQVIINKDGTIVFQYLSIDEPSNGLTVGIQDAAGTTGLQVAYNQVYVHDALAVLFYQDATWLSATPTSGTIPQGGSAILDVVSDPTGLIPGSTHYGNVLIQSNDPDEPVSKVHVELNITSPCAPTISVNPTSVCDTLVAGTIGLEKPVTISNSCQYVNLNFNTVESPDELWLNVVPTNGIIVGATSTQIQLTFDATGMLPGLYTTTLFVTSDDPVTPSVPVTICLKVTGAPLAVIEPDSICPVITIVNGPVVHRAASISNTGSVPLVWRLDDTQGIPAAPGSLRAAGFSAGQPVPNEKKLELFKDVVNGATPELEPGARIGGDPEAKGYESPLRGGLQPYAQGGPDAFGYRWIDSDQVGGPAAEWIEIEGLAGTVDTGINGDDQNRGPFALGFDFPYYGTNYNSMRVCSNGWISPTGTGTTFTNTALPNTALPNATIAPFWDDLLPAPTRGKVWFRTDPSMGRAIFEWKKVPRFSSPADTLTFQVILCKDGSIQYNYLRLNGVTNSATVGIENAAGTVGLQVAFNAAYLHNGMSILIQNEQEWLSVTPTSGTIAPGGTQLLNVAFDPTGLAIGPHRGFLRFKTNDPTQSKAIVPVCLTVEDPVAVALARFEALSTPDGVNVSWETADETDHSYFDVYRSEGLAGEYLQVNQAPITGDGRYEFTDAAVVDGSEYRYRLEAVDRNGARQSFGPIVVTYSGRPASFNLVQNYPNPFAGRTTFQLALPAATDIRLRVFDATGRLVRSFHEGTMDAGRHTFEWNGQDDNGQLAAAGFYFLRADSPLGTKTVRMMLVK